MVSDRSMQVLRVIVTDYVTSREPVGSKSIADRHDFGVSAATIRNDMAQLEDAELIVAPHTSSGRIPTDKGYRLFVDRLAEFRPLSGAQRRAIETFIEGSDDVDEVLGRSVRLLAQLTNSVAIAQYPSLANAAIQHVEFVLLSSMRVLTVLITDSGRVEQRIGHLRAEVSVEQLHVLRDRLAGRLVGKTVARASAELRDVSGIMGERDAELFAPVIANLLELVLAHRQERLVMAGTANLARTERDFPSSILPVLEAIEEQVVLLRLLDELHSSPEAYSVSIGQENVDLGLGETAILTSGYRSSGSDARLGVVGPTRMDYPRNIQAVRVVASYLSRVLDEQHSDD